MNALFAGLEICPDSSRPDTMMRVEVTAKPLTSQVFLPKTYGSYEP